MTSKVLLADALSPTTTSALRALGLEVSDRADLDAGALADAIADHDILIVRGKKVSAEVFARASRLGLVIRAGAGVNTIDVAAASARGVFVTNCPGQNSIAVAELTLGLLLAVDRRIPRARAELLAGNWNKADYQEADGLYGKTLGLLGFGSIAKEVARRAQGLGLEVLAWSRSLDDATARQHGVGLARDPSALAAASDIVSIHLPLDGSTRGLVGGELLGRMKDGAILINTARGGIVDEVALLQQMTSRGLRYGCDVFDGEPGGGKATFESPLARDPRVVCTPHIGASTEQAQTAIAAEAVRIVEAFVRQGRVLNCVNLKTTPTAAATLMVRHHDRVGALAGVLDAIRAASINVQEVENVIFAAGGTACARLCLAAPPPPAILAAIGGMPDVIGISLVS